MRSQFFDTHFIPARRRRGGEKKICLVLHGRGDSLTPFKNIHRELGVYHTDFLLLNAPRKYDGGYTWYAFPPHQANGILLARQKLFGLMVELEAAGYQSHNVFLMGFSQGCLISCDMGLHFPKPLAGIIGVSGYIYFFKNWRARLPQSARKTPWLITHGTRDDALDIGVTRLQVEKLKSAGIPVRWLEFDKGHDWDEEEEMPTIREFISAH